MKKTWLTCFIHITIISKVQMDLTTTFLDLQPLLEIQKNVIEDLQPVIERRIKTLDFLQRQIKSYKYEHKKATKDLEQYFGNPINTIKFIIRQTSGLKALEDLIMQTNGAGFKKRKSDKHPTLLDFDESIRSLLRLQRIYQLNVEEISEGILKTNFTEDRNNFVEYTSPMSVDDCYLIGKGIIARKGYKEGLPWLLNSLRKYEDKKLHLRLKKSNIIYQIVKAYNDMGKTEKYIEWMNKLIELKPSKKENLEIFLNIAENNLQREHLVKTQIMRNRKKKSNRKPKKQKPLIDPVKVVKTCGMEQITNVFKMLCRGDVTISRKITKRLKCWYSKGYHPFLILAPVKTEQLFHTPDIFMFHDVFYDDEIKVIKNLSIPELRDGATGYGDPLKRYNFIPKMVHRICKSAFIKKKSEILDRVSQRISDISGFILHTSEFLHVSNYGASGFFIPHYDFWMHNYFDKTYGNRFATLIAYMSDVEQGGATVFLPFGLTVFPKKGAALLWNNLDATHEGDRLTCHGACPVLRGSKWIATQWISKLGQELIRPCVNAAETRRSIDLPYPEPRI